jgi:hypothetical protein
LTEVNGSEPAPQEVVTLFLVVVDTDGSSRVVLNANERFMAHRQAGPKDVYPALANVLADFQGLKTAEAIASLQMQMAKQMAEAQAGTQKDSETP